LDTVAFFRSSFDRLHSTTVEAVKGLSVEQLNFRPDDQHHSIAWVLWHLARTEDVVMRALVQKKPELWVEGGWPAKLGMPERGQGTGQTPEQAAQVRIEDPEAFLAYAREVWRDIDSYLSGLKEEDLDAPYPWRRSPTGEEPLGQVIGNHVMTHLFGHRNEIYWLRSLQGLQGSPY
jgi:uncharacterized damage-inducible protein DinB